MVNYYGKEVFTASNATTLNHFQADKAVHQENMLKQSGHLLPARMENAPERPQYSTDVLQSGRSMIEMLGVLAIIGVLSVGGIAGYSKAMTKFKINKTIEQISHIVANTRTLYASQPDYGNITEPIIRKAHIAPDDMWGDSGSYGSLVNAFGGGVRIFTSEKVSSTSDKKAFVVAFYNIPEDACIELATQDWGAATGSGLIAVGVANGNSAAAEIYNIYCNGDSAYAYSVACPNGSRISVPMPIAEAALRCSGDDNVISLKYY